MRSAETRNNEPKQERSRISQAKVVNAASHLLARHGYDGFTLQQVSAESGVSIGSIYGRFASKDELVHFIHRNLLDHMDAVHNNLLDAPEWQDMPLFDLVPPLFDRIAETLRENAPLLRAFMLRAVYDDVISTVGSQSFKGFVSQITALLMRHAHELQTDQPEAIFRHCITSAYSTYGNFLGLGSNRGERREVDWDWYKAETGRMLVSYLVSYGMRGAQG
ncbi:TetR/AcrR family transcriptional regulator [Allorhizobium terrae]|uniref:TetR/AcrR family transcriptional regulator n=1 Tax=Allorhizobium terrae TaxID=1848972 RepID=A0A4S3ZY14_9HYPH|nr:TetR family transcriptional regulator [Allorhizobium terrae]THF50802.1 TetR/AcrR family transcriptional regulator [Allorhizobium terrae]